MALPVNLGTGTVTCTIIDTTGDPEQGQVKFTPEFTQNRDITSTPKVMITKEPVTADLDENGSISQVLLATDDTDLNPTGWTWKVEFLLASKRKLSGFSFELPEGSTVDLADAAPVGSSGGVLITRGPAGEGVDTTGATDGQVPSYDAGTDSVVWIDPPTGGGTALTDYSTQIEPLPDYPTSFPTTWGDVDQKPAVIAAGADAAAARSAISAGRVDNLVAGTNISIDATNPAQPIITATGTVAELDSYAADVATLSDYPTSFPPATHTHVMSDVTDLAAELATKSDVGHTHSADDIDSGLLSMERMPSGFTFKIYYDGTDWRLGSPTGTVITARPTARTDLSMECVNSTTQEPPSFALPDVDVLAVY